MEVGMAKQKRRMLMILQQKYKLCNQAIPEIPVPYLYSLLI